MDSSACPFARHSTNALGTWWNKRPSHFSKTCRADVFLILDDAESLHQGKFRKELRLLRDLFRRTRLAG